MNAKTLSVEELAELERLMEAATPGRWKCIETKHPFSYGPQREQLKHHIERRIFTEWEHPQLQGCYPVVTCSTGLGMAQGQIWQFVSISEQDAALIVWLRNHAPALIAAAERDLEVRTAPGAQT